MKITDLDATAQAELVHRGEVRPLELVDAAIEAIERVEPQVDAVLHRTFDYAREQARSVDESAPFPGVPTMFKDWAQQVQGLPYSFGGLTPFRSAPLIGDEDSHLAAGLREAGFAFLGRTNTPFGAVVLPSADLSVHKMPRNPWNPDYSTGGSSSGSAAAVAARLVPVAHGNDGGGSIRIPASLTGTVGLKPTRARTSVGPFLTETSGPSSSWLSEFMITRSVRDAATLLNTLQGWRPGDCIPISAPRIPSREQLRGRTGLRIGLTTTPFSSWPTVDPEAVQAAHNAAKQLEALGHEIVPVAPPRYDLQAWPWDYGAPAGPAFAMLVRLYDKLAKRLGRPITVEDVGPQLWTCYLIGQSYTHAHVSEFGEFELASVVAFDRWWAASGIEVLLTPTVAGPTPPMSECEPPPTGTVVLREDNVMDFANMLLPMVPFCQIFNWTGQPAISLPLYENSNGLPLGVQLAAGRMQDELLLGLAYDLEEALPWADRRPAVCA